MNLTELQRAAILQLGNPEIEHAVLSEETAKDLIALHLVYKRKDGALDFTERGEQVYEQITTESISGRRMTPDLLLQVIKKVAAEGAPEKTLADRFKIECYCVGRPEAGQWTDLLGKTFSSNTPIRTEFRSLEAAIAESKKYPGAYYYPLYKEREGITLWPDADTLLKMIRQGPDIYGL